jgi:hypothetical protein
MITMLKLIIPLKEHTIMTVLYDCEKRNQCYHPKKIPPKKDAKKNLLHIEKPTKKYEYGINIYSIVFIIAHYYNVI